MPIPLGLGLQAHLGPRTLLAGKHRSEWLPLCGSVLAGDQQSGTFTRMLLYDLLESCHNVWPMAGPIQQVDDLAQTVEGKDEDQVFQRLAPCAVHLATSLQAKRFTISEKSSIVPASCPAAQRVFRALRRAGVPARLAMHERDVGIDTSAGLRRVLKVHKKRQYNAAIRNKLVAKMSKHNRLAKKLFATGVRPQAAW